MICKLENQNETIKSYFEGIGSELGLKVLYSRKQAINVILENVDTFPIIIISPINSFSLDILGRAVMAYEVAVVDICPQDYDETQEEEKENACVKALSKILRKVQFQESSIVSFQRLDANLQKFYDMYDSNLMGALCNVYLKRKTDVCV
jgi:hypothetical protein